MQQHVMYAALSIPCVRGSWRILERLWEDSGRALGEDSGRILGILERVPGGFWEDSGDYEKGSGGGRHRDGFGVGFWEGARVGGRASGGRAARAGEKKAHQS